MSNQRLISLLLFEADRHIVQYKHIFSVEWSFHSHFSTNFHFTFMRRLNSEINTRLTSISVTAQ